jgi:hypothetical protein
MRVRAFCFCLALAFGSATQARDIYVNNLAGDDRYSGDLPDNSAGAVGPVRTIAKATRIAGPGDRIVLAATDEPYRETVSLVGQKHSESGLSPLVLAGNGAILDGSLPVPSFAWEQFAGDVYRFRPDRLAHQQLFIKGRPALRRPATSWYGVVPQLEPLEWNLTGGYIYFRTEPGQIPDAYQPSYAALQTGITLYHVRGVEVTNLVVQGFQLDGINAFDAATDIRLIGVTARGNGRSGISVGGSSRVEIRDALLGDNGSAQLRTEGYSKTYIFDCDLIGNTAPAEMVEGGQLWIDGKPFSPAEK